ncbi:MAG: phage holin family protein [Patescibacteria group bacterium]
MIKSFAFLLVSYFCLSQLDNMVSTISLNNNWVSIALFLIILTIINSTVMPILKLISFPVNFLSLGTFNLILNILVLMISIRFSEAISINSTGLGFLVDLGLISLTLSVANTIINVLFIGQE